MSLFSIAERTLNHFPSPIRRFAEPLLRSEVALRLARGTLWNGFSAVFSRIITLAGIIVVARFLGKEQFGELGMITSTAGMFSTLAGFGIGMTATKYIAELRCSNPERAGRIIGLSNLFTLFSGSIVSIALFLIIPWLAKNTIAAPHLVPQLRICALGLFLGTINGALSGVLTGLEAFRSAALIGVAVSFVTTTMIIIGTLLAGLTGAVWGTVLPLVFSVFVTEFKVRSYTKKEGIQIDYRNATKEMSILWRFSLPTFVTGMMAWPANWVCLAFLANTSGGYKELGLFSAANHWYGILVFLPGCIGSALMPIISNQYGEAGSKQCARVVHFTAWITFIIAAIPALALSAMSNDIIKLYGPTFADGGSTLVICLITGVIHATVLPFANSIFASGHAWSYLGAQWIWGIAFILGTYLLRENGAVGLSIARCLAYIMQLLVIYMLFRYTLKTVPNQD